ncbi:MAG: Crp/Fnr family transcriptional regulator [Geminocystis sp.]|nr:Crp/Fnr family transcriptional regulator [Geminocystis sp.]HIK38687.1 Crp/Fnr family transcriptional regulator [Geminocystis sp. M7585_C2015_104]MCS7147808.1 Crp/Fnr family transcriptional regulator [Geminocystis sp.]MCX8079172.1 Crp/Fnr family transcriptional regulator [Geminocystis sp.]MDW8116825.1 Crp/Fnr family transcriptional regulator [Geminocystis sp.]
METQEFSETFPLFHNLETETLEWLLSMTETESYDPQEILFSEESWGRGVDFIVSGWVKLENVRGEERNTIEIIGPGGFVGEAAILGNVASGSRVVAISPVESLTIPAQRFLQILHQDIQIQHRLLKLMVEKVGEYQRYCQFYRQPPKVRLATVLISLADKYGETGQRGIELFNFPRQDLASLAQLSLDECLQVMAKFENKGIIATDEDSERLLLCNIKQLHHIVGKLGGD